MFENVQIAQLRLSMSSEHQLYVWRGRFQRRISFKKYWCAVCKCCLRLSKSSIHFKYLWTNQNLKRQWWLIYRSFETFFSLSQEFNFFIFFVTASTFKEILKVLILLCASILAFFFLDLLHFTIGNFNKPFSL